MTTSCIVCLSLAAVWQMTAALHSYSVKEPLLSLPVGVRGHVTSTYDVRGALDEKASCSLIGLDRRQVGLCRRQAGSGSALLEATNLATNECRKRFARERWNCTMTLAQRNRLMRKGFRETGFLHAVTSAALVHVIARACSRGLLDGCTCGTASDDVTASATWRWGGCADDVTYACRFARRFLRRGDVARDLKGRIDRHNSRTGVKVVKKSVIRVCKCHGVSGSCSVKTCWHQMASFRKTGSALKRKYDAAVEVTLATNGVEPTMRRKVALERGSGRSRDGNSEPGRREIVFTESSPNFCAPGSYTDGTRGRRCEPEADCEILCCGRGYNTRRQYKDSPCYCHVVWCCHVKCLTCSHLIDVYHCK